MVDYVRANSRIVRMVDNIRANSCKVVKKIYLWVLGEFAPSFNPVVGVFIEIYWAWILEIIKWLFLFLVVCGNRYYPYFYGGNVVTPFKWAFIPLVSQHMLTPTFHKWMMGGLTSPNRGRVLLPLGPFLSGLINLPSYKIQYNYTDT